MKRFAMSFALVLLAAPVSAATLVTWQAEGTVLRRSDQLAPPEPGFPIAPPLGTPISVTLMFDPAAAFPSITGLPGGVPGCMTVDVTGSVTIGGFTAEIGSGSQGFTRAGLVGTTCAPSSNTEFGLFVPAAPADNPFKLPEGLLILSYRDLLARDFFPETPTPSFLADVSFIRFGDVNIQSLFQGQATLRAIDQTAPVPEPGTMTLLGLGLAAAIRARRKK